MNRTRLLQVVLGVVVVGGAAAGITYAAIPHGTYGDTTACFKTSNGALRVIDVAAGESCNAHESPLGLYQGYTQLVRRPSGPSGVAAGFVTYTPVVGSSLLGSHLPSVYAITGKAVILTKVSAVSACRLTAERSDVPKFTLDETRNSPALETTHNLQGMVFGNFNVRVECASDQVWSAIESSVLGIKVGKGASITTTTAEPSSP
jgi:hypothetical protein